MKHRMDELKAVLMVDGDSAVRAAYESAFAAAGFVVKTATTGSAAFVTLQRFKPDVVVFDVDAPVANGLHWLMAARRIPQFQDLPVVVVTAASPGSQDATAAQVAQLHGVAHKKSWTTESLIAVARWSARHRGVTPMVRAA